MSLVRYKMLCDIPPSKIIVNQIELTDITASSATPYTASIPLNGDAALKVHPIIVLVSRGTGQSFFNAMPGKDYDIEYKSSIEANVYIYTNGTFKINY